MRRLAGALALFAVGAVLALGAASPAQAATATSPDSVTVELDRTAVATRLGQSFRFESTVRNNGDQPMTGLIAHLNILSTDPGVYVDPEDWSPRRTQYLEPLPAGGSVRLSWTVQAVNSGPLVVYVAATQPATDTATVSDPLKLTVAAQRTINAGGILPVAAAMPVGILVLMGVAARRRRRLR